MQLHVSRSFSGLLSTKSGSIIFGLQIGSPDKGFITCPGHRDRWIFCHLPEGWTELWDGLVFEKGVVNVQAKLVQVEWKEPDGSPSLAFAELVWLVTHL